MKLKITLVPMLALLFISLFATYGTNKSFLAFATGTPDAYGNRISNMTVYQLNGAWAQVDEQWTYNNFTYPPGFSITCDAAKNTRFNVTVWINNTLASSAADAVTKTYVAITISQAGTPEAGWNPRIMNDAHSEGAIGNYYWVRWQETWDTVGKPLVGLVYDVTIDYDAYY